jgi:DNA-binding SARP family transcriptional activator
MESAIRDDRPASEESLARAHASLVVALLYRQPAHPLLRAGVRVVSDRLEREVDPSQKLRMAMFLAHYHDIMGEQAKARRAIGVVERLLIGEHADPLTSVVARMRCSHHFVSTGDHDRAIATADHALQMARDQGFKESLVGFLFVCRAHALLNAGALREAELTLRTAWKSIDAGHHMIVIYFYWCSFWCAMLREDKQRLRSLWKEFAGVPPAGVPINTAYNMPVVLFLVEEGCFNEAIERISRWKDALAGMRSPLVDFNLELMEALAWLHKPDREAAAAALRRAFALGSEGGFTNTLAWMPRAMSELCALALECGIEPDYAKRLIRERGLAPPRAFLPSWPWPVRIHVLGHFEVIIDGRPLSFSGRPQHRTLELLKIIIAFGGISVSVARITTLLWPDADGDAAQRSFAVTLHRLRKLLGSDRCIETGDGVVTLNQQRCWVDSMAFESITAEGVAEEDLLKLYRGHLLGEDESAWVLPQRARLRARFEQAVRGLGQSFEDRKDLGRALALYRRAIELEPLSEEFYRRAMACLRQQGSHAEAMEIYRRCRQMLSVVLGIAPSSETLNLFREIQAGGADETRQP